MAHMVGFVQRTSIAAAVALALAVVPPAAAESLEERVDQLEELLEGRGLAEMLRDLERLKRENQELRGEVEELGRAVRTLEQRQQDHYRDLDERLQEMEAAGAMPGEHARVPTPEITDEDDIDDDRADERELYRTAFDQLTEGLFAEARSGFEQVLGEFPEGRYAANARYWMAETHYAERDFEAAREHFERVLEDHPDSDKVPDALLKLGFVAFEKDDMEQARAYLQEVRDEHEGSTAASLAQQRLAEMRQLERDEDDIDDDRADEDDETDEDENDDS